MATQYSPSVIRLMTQLKALLDANNAAATVTPNPKPRQMATRAVPDEHMLRSIATCPHCGRRGRVRATFGVRDMGGGRLRVQSWCRDCRKEPNRPEALRFARQHKGGRR